MLEKLTNLELTHHEWRKIEKESLKAAEDYRIICLAINKEANVLSRNYKFIRGVGNIKSNEFTLSSSLYKKYEEAFEKEQINIVSTLNKSGSSFATFTEYLKKSSNENQRKTKLNYAKLLAWNKVKGHFFELLCLLSTLSSSEQIEQLHNIENVFQGVGPIPIVENSTIKNIWTQQTFSDTISGFNARPDIIITNPTEKASSDDIVDIIECKCVKNISSNTIRSEFGKAHDLRVNSYKIISYYDIDDATIEATQKLGIDIVPFPLNTQERDKYVENPHEIVRVLSESIHKSRKEKNFLRMLENAASESKSKLLIQ